MDVFLEIMVYSVMVLGGLSVAGAAFVFTGLALAKESQTDEEH